MNYFIQRGKVRSQVINVPDGLPEILSDITREVLRCQPTTECLCQFIIDYLHSVIVARDKARVAKNIIDRALIKVDEIISDMCVCDIPSLKAEQMALAMEECFKHFLAKRRCEISKDREIIKFSEIDILNELIHKCKFSDDELKISRPAIEAAYQRFVDAYMTAQTQTEGTEALYQYFRERDIKRMEERHQKEAATKIQAAVRGYLVRRLMLSEKRTSAFKLSEISEDSLITSKEQEEAARKIQKFFRNRVSERKSQTQALLDQDTCSPDSVLDLYVKTTKMSKAGSKLGEYADSKGVDGSGSTTVVSIQVADTSQSQEIHKPTPEYPTIVIDDAKDDKIKDDKVKDDKLKDDKVEDAKEDTIKDAKEDTTKDAKDNKEESYTGNEKVVEVEEVVELDDPEAEVVIQEQQVIE